MAQYQESFDKMGYVTVVVLALVAVSVSVHATEIVALEKIKPDNACGPRCLNALLRLRDGEKKACGIKGIYNLVGKEPFSVVNMKELGDAAVGLGFAVKAYKLDLGQLQKVKGYCIVPIGRGRATKDNPLHFMLVERVQDDYVIFLDSESLEAKALSVSEFARVWSGYALVLSSDKKMKPLRKEDVSSAISRNRNTVGGYYEVKDLGHVDRGSVLTHTFVIPREEAKGWQVRIVGKSCSCVTSELGKDTHGNTTLTVGYNIEGVGWQKAHVAVEIMPVKTVRKYGLVAFGKNSFKVVPKNCYISAPEGGVVRFPFEVRYFTDSEDVVRFDRVQCDNENITVEEVESRQVQGPSDITQHAFKMMLLYNAGRPGDKATTVTDRVDLAFNTVDGDRTISMDLFAKTGVDRCEVYPGEVFHVTSKSDILPITTRVKCRFFEDPLPQVSLKTEGKLPIKYSLTDSEDCYYIDMELEQESMSNVPLGLNTGNVYLTHPNEDIPEIVIPVRLFVRE